MNSAIRLEHAVAIADVGDAPVDLGGSFLRRQRLQHGVQRRLGVFDHQQTRHPEGDQPIADFGADRAAAAGHDRGLALHEMSRAADSRSSRSAAAAGLRH